MKSTARRPFSHTRLNRFLEKRILELRPRKSQIEIASEAGFVQPANRSKKGMFDDDAPIWHFKQALSAVEDPAMARAASHGTYLVEVFPALALAAIESAFCARLAAPKYNPANRSRFRLYDWQAVIAAVNSFGVLHAVHRLEEWCLAAKGQLLPRKADQDKLDALICGLVGLHWIRAPRSQSAMIGDLQNGYMIAPATDGMRSRLTAAAEDRRVPIS